ncbi:VOC family protein [Leptolyngbya sp. FACHB-261]|uniref:VOC family protein n=1 Tax=Leptolyngbya sp. FACHB-261 TaxID=2692806 RepID=UPI0016822E0D|nr:VOC family protein [Leptolyngbya sp. FACHB-261]MBD2103839.1 VOC family protein [Leptolyngbya sp. FACHB-261]
MKVTGFLHVAVLISDLERAMAFYGGILGLEAIERQLKFPGAWYRIGPQQLHLMVGDGEARKNCAEKWGRNPHLALAVADLNIAKERLVTHGYSVQMSASGRQALFVQDPDGNVIELSEAP